MRLLAVSLLAVAALAADKFPAGFAWGVATAAYQVEGAVKEGGRGPSIWDDFSHIPGKVYNNQTGDVADDHFHRFQEDVQLMANMGVKHYRLSLSWSRLLPTGEGNASQAGIDFYTSLFTALAAHNIEPFVTLYHWDLPSGLEAKYNGWLDPTFESISDAFGDYARLAFTHFGKYVKRWLTFNEPLSFVVLGYQNGQHAPGRCSDRKTCPAGDSTTEPYVAGHNVLIAHAKAAKVYRDEFQQQQGGQIGMTNTCDWQEPLDPSSAADLEAAERSLQWGCGWWIDPQFFGDYPMTMRARLGQRLPVFTRVQIQMLTASKDFIGLNHYSSRYVTQAPSCPTAPQTSWAAEACVQQVSERNGVPIGPPSASDWLLIVPWGMRKIVNWVAARYDNAPIYVTENGCDEDNTPQPVLNDTWRIDFYTNYLSNLSAAITDGADVRGYFAWSFMDNFEWANGYSKRFGLHHVDYSTLQRTPKASVKWYSDYIAQHP